MSFKIKVKIDLDKQLQAAQSQASRQIKSNVKKIILDNYSRGLSPVKGFGSFTQYAASTAKKKGRRKPVTINETGKLWASLKVVQNGRGALSLFFQGARSSKIAGFITFGTKNMDARPLLPAANGQEFKVGITKQFTKAVSDALKKFFK